MVAAVWGHLSGRRRDGVWFSDGEGTSLTNPESACVLWGWTHTAGPLREREERGSGQRGRRTKMTKRRGPDLVLGDRLVLLVCENRNYTCTCNCTRVVLCLMHSWPAVD